MRKGFKSIPLFCLLLLAQMVHADIEAGSTVQALSNLHPDLDKNRLYSVNYQMPGLIPVCSTLEVKKVKKKKMVFSWNGTDYTFLYDKHTKKAGVSFQERLASFFGSQCDN